MSTHRGHQRGHPRYGGRHAGTPNKRTSEEAAIFERLGGPKGETYARRLHQFAVGPNTRAALKALQIIALYVWQKQPQAWEHTGPAGGPLLTTIIHEHHRTS